LRFVHNPFIFGSSPEFVGESAAFRPPISPERKEVAMIAAARGDLHRRLVNQFL